MELHNIPLTEGTCLRNFERWKRELASSSGSRPPREHIEFAQLPCTHTFPSIKIWAKQDQHGRPLMGPRGERMYGKSSPSRQILFEHRALLSDGERESRGFIEEGEPRREMARVRELGLHWFIFCYHGAHDPRYGGIQFSDSRPFGLFVSRSLEQFPMCHASRRDIDESNPDVALELIADVWELCMTPGQARDLLPIEIAHDPRFSNDFWEYWGAESQWGDPQKRSKHWTWKYEFRFFRKIAVESVEAILWPANSEYHALTGTKMSAEMADLNRFRREYPDIAVVDYPWSADFNTMSFWSASCKSALFYCRERRFPRSWNELAVATGRNP